MTVKQLLAAALLAALSPAAAHAADPASLGCIRAELGTTVYQAIVERKVANWGAPLNDAIGKDANAYLDASDRCNRKHGWSEAARRLASMYVKSQFTHDAAELALRRSGVDPAAYAADYARLDPAERRLLSAENGATTPKQAAHVTFRLIMARGAAPKAGDPVVGYLAALMAGLATIEFVPEKFAAA